MLNWQWRSFAELNSHELYDLLALRQEVFIIEQTCIYPDLDYYDQKAMHLLGWKNNKLVAYARLFENDIRYPNSVSIGRIVTSPSIRGEGIGKELMRFLLEHLDKTNNNYPITISARFYLEKFYTDFGFQPVGELYDEDGTPHIKMIRDYAKING